jgi:ElaB/YqjD/DUF883 family membrane-anchored ribosome-binding protein
MAEAETGPAAGGVSGQAGSAPSRAAAHPAAPPPDLPDLFTSAAGRLQQLIDEANAAANAIREEARSQASHHVEELRKRAEHATEQRLAKLDELTDALLTQVTDIKQQTDAFGELLRQSIQDLKRELGDSVADKPGGLAGAAEGRAEGGRGSRGTPAASGAPRQRRGLLSRRRKGEAGAHAGGSSAKVRFEPGGISPAARVLAQRLMNEGADRGTIERRLKSEFGMENPDRFLDAL